MLSDNYKTLPRLFLECADMREGEKFEISNGQHHYLRNVMRVEAGAQVRCFNGQDGEWVAEINEMNKNKTVISFVKKIREQKNEADIWVVASPIKKEAFDFMIEKASELGASRFLPVLCEHTVIHRTNTERMRASAVESAEQCERLDVMRIDVLSKLKNILETWDLGRTLIFCIERKQAPPLLETLRNIPAQTPLAVLVGPEGGFSAQETVYIQSLPFVASVSLGSRILRAETALLAALACIQSARDT